MKKVLVIGASGLIGQHISAQLNDSATVITASFSDQSNPVDIANPTALKGLLEKVGHIDAIICTAGMVNFVPWDKATDDDWTFGISNKMMGQINIIRFGAQYLNAGGAIILTTGVLAQHPFPSSGIVSTVNAAVEAAVKASSLELDGIRINAVSPGWVKETMDAMGMDSTPGMPAADVAQVYIDLLEHSESGEIRIAAK